jgi:hypothetical protein
VASPEEALCTGRRPHRKILSVLNGKNDGLTGRSYLYSLEEGMASLEEALCTHWKKRWPRRKKLCTHWKKLSVAGGDRPLEGDIKGDIEKNQKNPHRRSEAKSSLLGEKENRSRKKRKHLLRRSKEETPSI